MPSPYSGNPASFPESAMIPSDGDKPKVSSVNPAFEALFDRTAWLRELILQDKAFANYDTVGIVDTFVTTSFVDTTAFTPLSFPLSAVGDWIFVVAFMNYGVLGGSGDGGELRLHITDDYGGTPTVADNTGARIVSAEAPTDIQQGTIAFLHQVLDAGTTRIVVQGKNVASGSLSLVHAGYIWGVKVRFT